MTRAVLISVGGMASDAVAATAAACRSVGLDVIAGGEPTGPVAAVVAALPTGMRRVPEEARELAESLAARLILLSADSLLRPITVLGRGAVTIVSPPFDRRRLLAALCGASGGPASASPLHHYENLRRASWVAWQRAAGAAATVDLDHPDDNTLTAVIDLASGIERSAAEVASLLDAASTDGRREAILWESVGVDGAVIQLSSHADEWLVYWPAHEQSLTLWSSQRLPARWSLAGALALSRRRMVRLAAYPDDLLVAVIAADAEAAQRAAHAGPLLGGGPDARAALASSPEPGLTCLLVAVL